MDRNFLPLVGALSLSGQPWDTNLADFYQGEMQITLDIIHSMHELSDPPSSPLLTVCSFNPGSGRKFHPQLILSSCGGKKQENTWQEIPTLNKIWIDTVSSPLMSMQVLSLLTLQLPIPLFSFRRALRGGQHGMKLLLPPSLCWVGVLNTRFLLGTVLLHWYN